MTIHNLISNRRSIRSFSDESITDEVLISLFEAARWAPSSMNEQPWRFIYARREEKEQFELLLSCLNESNRLWAQNGALLIMTIAKTNFKDGTVNHFAWHDVGLSIGNLTMQATSLDLYMHQMGGFRPDIATRVFKVPDNFRPVSISVIGYKGNPDLLPEHLQQREMKKRERIPLTDLVYSGSFGNHSAIFN